MLDNFALLCLLHHTCVRWPFVSLASTSQLSLSAPFLANLRCASPFTAIGRWGMVAVSGRMSPRVYPSTDASCAPFALACCASDPIDTCVRITTDLSWTALPGYSSIAARGFSFIRMAILRVAKLQFKNLPQCSERPHNASWRPPSTTVGHHTGRLMHFSQHSKAEWRKKMQHLLDGQGDRAA